MLILKNISTFEHAFKEILKDVEILTAKFFDYEKKIISVKQI